MTALAFILWGIAGLVAFITAVMGARTGTAWIVALAFFAAGLFAWVLA